MIINTNFDTAKPGHSEIQKITPNKKIFEKKKCFTQNSKLGQQKMLFLSLLIYHKTKKTSLKTIWWICDLYDLDCVDDQHSHGKSVGKYLMVNRVKTAFDESRISGDPDECRGNHGVFFEWMQTKLEEYEHNFF